MAFKKHKNEFDRVHKQYNLFMKLTKLNHNKEIKNLLDLKRNETLLDIGGGTGLLAKELSKNVKKYITIDKSKKMLEHHEIKENIQIIEADFFDYKFEEEFFDIIILSDVVHHIKDQNKLLKKSYKLLKKGGLILIHDFNKESKRVKALEKFENYMFGDIFLKTTKEMENLLKDNCFDITKKLDKNFYFILIGVKNAS